MEKTAISLHSAPIKSKTRPKFLKKLGIAGTLLSSLYFGLALKTEAATQKLQEAGFSKGGTLIPKEEMADLTGVVYLIMGIGLLWGVIWIVIGGTILSGAGSNPQKRAAGFAAIGAACVGLYIVYRAYSIAAFVTNLTG